MWGRWHTVSYYLSKLVTHYTVDHCFTLCIRKGPVQEILRSIMEKSPNFCGSLQPPIFVDQSTPNCTCLCGSVRSLQCHFQIDDVLLHMGDIHDKLRSCVKSCRNSMFLGHQISGGGEGPSKFLTEFCKSGIPSTVRQSLVTIS